MAIKPTIYKFNINLSNLNQNYYKSLNLTVALHPSETIERMMARMMAYCINADENLVFTKGLSEVDEPDIWLKTLDDQIALWIDVGEPDFERMKKVCRLSKHTKVYSFNSKSDVWWSQAQSKFKQLPIEVIQFLWSEIETLTLLLQRTMPMSVTITSDSAYVATESGECEINWTNLQD